MADDTHRYDGSKLYRADGTLVENGQTLTPTDAELKAFGDTLTEFRAKSRDEATDPATDETDAEPDQDQAAPDTDQDQTQADETDTDLSADQEALADHVNDPADYGQIRSLAASTDGVKGNASQEDMTAALAEKARQGDL